MSDLLERVAGAPITWGVDESPGWGHLMGRDRVLAEMPASGLPRRSSVPTASCRQTRANCATTWPAMT